MKNILKYKWFQLSTRQRMSPFPNVHSMESMCSDMKKVIGIAYETILILFENRIFRVFFDKNDYDKVGRFTFNKLNKDPKLFKGLIQKENKYAKPFLTWLKNLNKKNLTKVNNKELIKYHHHYISDYKRIYSHYFVIITLEKILIEYLIKLLKDKLQNDEEKAGKYLTIMITEPRAMVSKREEISALKISIKIKKNNQWSKLFEKDINEIKSRVRDFPELFNLIKKHEKEFFWLTRDYEDPVLTFEDIITRIKEHLSDNPEIKLNMHENESKDLERKRNAIIKELNLTPKEQAMFEAMRDGMHLKELRKRIVSESLYWYDIVLKEIGKRNNLAIKQVRFLLEDEVNELFTQKKNWEKILNNRIKRSGYFAYKGKTRVFSSKNVDELFKKLIKIDKNIKEIRGFSASPGKATGIVKIVMNPDEGDKVKKGDIIVNAQVVPSFSPLISIAGGLVCDGGTGITSHPATLAREAKIPCVTGTKIATRLLKDGDKIEVDGYKGIVKILK